MTRNDDSVKTKPTSQQIVVGCFHRAGDARRAIEALHSHSFAPDQIGAAFREAEPAQRSAEIAGSSEHDSATWFRQLRHTYDHGRETDEAPAAGEFESSLSRLRIPPERARRLAQDLAPCEAIVTVNAGSRRHEAESLLEQNGAVIEHEQNLQPAAVPEKTVQVPVTREHLVVEHTDDTGRVDPKDAIRVPLNEERVRVDKDTVLREESKRKADSLRE